jgi:endonuclease/exonuclease/phosphatase family metal-dependent hydrolase
MGWLLLGVARHVLSGRVWWWVLPDLLPPVVFALVPVVLLAAIPLSRLGRTGPPVWAAWWTAASAAAALAVGVPQSGLNLGVLTGAAGATPSPPGAVRVMVWDTFGWDTGKYPSRLYRYLRAQHAAVYMLQEHMAERQGQPWPLRDAGQLRRAFPGYHIAAAGELLTISRFPIAASRPLRAPQPPPDSSWAAYWGIRVLRTDIRIGGRTLSVYNAHLPDLLTLGVSGFSPAFYRVVHELFIRREAQLRALRADITHNPNPVLVGGDLNVLPGTGDLRWLAGLSDAAHASSSLYPASLLFGFLPAWRVDWAFTSPRVRVYSYALVSPAGLSVHDAQDLVISLAPRPPGAPRRPGGGSSRVTTATARRGAHGE